MWGSMRGMTEPQHECDSLSVLLLLFKSLVHVHLHNNMNMEKKPKKPSRGCGVAPYNTDHEWYNVK